METEKKPVATEETERLNKSKACEIEADKDSIRLADLSRDHQDKPEAEETRSEQALEFLTGGERYIKD